MGKSRCHTFLCGRGDHTPLNYNPRAWLSLLFGVKGSVIAGVWDEVLVTALFSFAANAIWVWHFDEDPDVEMLNPVIHGFIVFPLSFLLIFRTNQAYSRWWTARGAIGTMVRSAGEFTRHVVAFVGTLDRSARIRRQRATLIRHINLIFLLIQQDLEQDSKGTIDWSISEPMMKASEAKILKKTDNSINVVALWITTRIGKLQAEGKIAAAHARSIDQEISAMVGAWMTCAKINRTLMPFAYAQMVQWLLTIFVFSIPFAYVKTFRWWGILVSCLIAICFFGLNEVAVDIEQPFGTDATDFQLTTVYHGIRKNSLDLLSTIQRTGNDDGVSDSEEGSESTFKTSSSGSDDDDDDTGSDTDGSSQSTHIADITGFADDDDSY